MIVTAEINDRTTVQDLMEFVCKKQGLNVTDHFLQLKLPNSNSIKIPDKTVQLYAEVSYMKACAIFVWIVALHLILSYLILYGYIRSKISQWIWCQAYRITIFTFQTVPSFIRLSSTYLATKLLLVNVLCLHDN